MQPSKGSSFISLPMSFDSGSGTARVRRSGVKLWLFIVVVLWLVFSIIGLVIADGLVGYTSPLWLLFLFTYVVRYIIVREKFYRAKRRELQKSDFSFQHTLFWNILDYSYRYPYFVTFENGQKGVYVAFDKGVVIGKGEGSSFEHFEGLASGYAHVISRNIEMIHIDYMDIVGQDKRLAHLYSLAENAENEDIKRVLMRMADHTRLLMDNVYASYDVYCFYSRARDDQFWYELEPCLEAFLEANYSRYRVLDREQIVPLVESLMNLSEFSVSKATEGVFRKLNRIIEYIRPIWVEKMGERKVLNRTLEELTEERRVTQAESKVKRKGSVFSRRKEADNDVDIFGTIQAPPSKSKDGVVGRVESRNQVESDKTRNPQEQTKESDGIDLFSE